MRARPRTFFNRSASTFIGPGDGADPGAGWGKAVDMAVWNDTWPSTFCITWWMWPFSTETDPNRFRYDSALALSSVAQPHSGYTDQSGMWANTTIGVLLLRRLTSFSSHSSCSFPSD